MSEPVNKPNDRPEEDFAKVSEMNDGPVQEDENETTLNTVFKGAKWGAVAGCVFSAVYIRMNTPASLGFYPGDLSYVFLVCIGGPAAVGALLGWLSTKLPADEGDR